MNIPEKAMILAAGLGTRMRPLTDQMPKPLVPFAGKPLIDHLLIRLEQAGVVQLVVNLHHFADQLQAHLVRRRHPKIILSDERAELLDTGGGVKKALSLLGNQPFFTLNSDALWTERKGQIPALQLLAENWNPDHMDGLLLLAGKNRSCGLNTPGDFNLDDAGRVSRRNDQAQAAFYYTGVQLIHPNLFEAAPEGPFSLNLLWNQAIERGRLYGYELPGHWLHIGTPQTIDQAQDYLNNLGPDHRLD